MKSAGKPVRLVIVSIIAILAIVLPLAWSKLAKAGSTSAGNRAALSLTHELNPELEPALFFPTYTVKSLADTSVILGGNTTITPALAPVGAVRINVSTSTNFKGTFVANPTTGVVRVTNAHPVGLYLLTVKAFDSGGGVISTTTHNLMVQTPSATCPTATFFNAADVGNGTHGCSVAVGDFNNDGKQDLAIAFNTANWIAIRFGNGAGSFTGTTNVPIGPASHPGHGIQPDQVVIGDFNNDGNQDFATANYYTGTISIRLGDGLGGFTGETPTSEITTGSNTHALAVGDFNGDGRPDLAVANPSPGTVSILLGDGLGGFGAPASFNLYPPRSIAIGDFNSDEKQDLAIASFDSVVIYTGDGLGGFGSSTNINVGSGSRVESVAIGDFNNDGKQDFITANAGFTLTNNTASVVLGNGLGGFGSAANVTVGTGPYSIAPGDFNNDGKQDFATANYSANSSSIRLGDGLGGFSGSTEIDVGGSPISVAIGDFNGDNNLDFASGNVTTHNASVRLGTCIPNTAPTITAQAGVTRQQGLPVFNSQIATVSDANQAADTLTVTATPLTGSGVGVADISVDASGNVTANMAASCTATDSTFTLTVMDTFGVAGTASLTVNVEVDSQPPTVSCPSNMTQPANANLCTTVVNFTTPKATDNCGATVACSPASGATFVKGVTTVTCAATDGAGNTDSCTFTVTVNDTQAPTIACPANISKVTDVKLCSAVVSYVLPTVADNCPGVGLPDCTPPSGTTFAKGTTTVTCTVKDASNLQSSCNFTVTVNDTQAPSITCPANQTRAFVNPTDTTVVVTYPSPTFSDNCPGASVACLPPSGSAFPLGTTTVTCTAVDAANNQAVCNFTVTTFDVCLQDDSNTATVLLFNSFTGAYRFCCRGSIFAGKGTVQKLGGNFTLTHNTVDRRVTAKLEIALNRGTGSLQSPIGTTRCTISDRDTRNNLCLCTIAGS